MGCSTSFFPTPYLGLPLGAKYKFTQIWNAVIEKFEKILAILAKTLGGLGVKDLSLALQKQADEMKCPWKFNQDDVGLWKEIIIAKYGRLSHWRKLSEYMMV